MSEAYPYEWRSTLRYPDRFGQHCRIASYRSLVRGFVIIEFDDGTRRDVSRLNVRLREAYKREEVTNG